MTCFRRLGDDVAEPCFDPPHEQWQRSADLVDCRHAIEQARGLPLAFRGVVVGARAPGVAFRGTAFRDGGDDAVGSAVSADRAMIAVMIAVIPSSTATMINVSDWTMTESSPNAAASYIHTPTAAPPRRRR